jgi:hypothetical protein
VGVTELGVASLRCMERLQGATLQHGSQVYES